MSESTLPTLPYEGRRSWLRAWWPVLLVGAGLFLASSLPADNLPRRIWFPGQDKAQHAIAYALFGGACARAIALRRLVDSRWRSTILKAAALALAFGVSDEFHQWFVPGRGVEGLDVVADLAGGILGAVGVFWWRRNRRLPRPPSGR